MAIYRAIISPCAVSSNPSIDCNSPNAAMMAPPGTPGAATIAMPSIMMKPAYCPSCNSPPDIRIIAIEQATIFIVLPDR